MAQPKVVICGSFRRDPAGIARLFRELETNGCRVLSPLTLDFSDTSSDFVTAKNDETFSVRELERFHLRAIREADFVMLHAPGGYVGISTSFELGYAVATGKPVFSKDSLNDVMLQSQFATKSSVFEVLETIF